MQEATPIIIKKKKVQGHGHHGGAWKVAYADFVTAMMAFFMVMWIMGMSQETRDVIQGYFRDPAGFMKNPPKLSVNVGPEGGTLRSPMGQAGAADKEKEEVAVMRAIRDQIEQAAESDPASRKLLESKGVEVKLTPDGVIVELTENEQNSEVFFKLGRAEVRPAAREILAKIAPILAKTGREMVVDGHTDARPLPTANYDNFDLSHDRANAVRRLLRSGGVPEEQFLAVRGFAARQPRRPEDPNHFSNRRVSILIPYSFKQATIAGLPADVSRESVEGVFRVPKPAGPDAVDLRRE
ncbi:MAG: OmpA family protein [Fimbriimonadaceae bacterium]|nr:OmpA family protein [Fimbriimonadaceae bacterium]QYK56164.1 MAG: OmpA family protein [Fimbriimonadaceae bacterium]